MKRQRQSLLLLALAALALCGAPPRPARAQGQPDVTITPTVIPLSDPELVNPTRGYYRWYGAEPIPQPRPAYDQYARYGWRQLEPARGTYDFSAIEQALQAAQAQRAKFGFRVMSVNEFTSPVEVPSYLIAEAGGSYCSYGGQRIWVPDWNSPAFLERARALAQALGARFDGDPRLLYYDLGIYGHWGEWHNGGLCVPEATAASKRALVDMQIDAFPRSRVLMNSGGSEVDAFVYALGKSPRVGVRVDSLCDTSFDQQFTQNAQKLAAMQDRWKTAPLIAEFFSYNPTNLSLCQQQVSTWHVAGIANGQINWGSYSAEQQAQLLTLGKQSGYRYVLNQITYPAAVTPGTTVGVSTQWSNQGVAPVYEPFQVSLELQLQGQSSVAWSWVSQLDLQQVLPAAQPQPFTDQLYVPSRLTPGQYTLSVVVRDPTRYRAPLALAIGGANSSLRYTLGTVSVGQGGSGHSLFVPVVLR
jgi:hypothetical protein